MNVKVRELQDELKGKEEEWRQREAKLKVGYEKEHQKAEEMRRQEQQMREEERVRRADRDKRAEEEWKRQIDEERKAHAQAVKMWAEKAAILNSEVSIYMYYSKMGDNV